MALGADYYIKAVILLKGKPSEANRTEAKKALLHSAEIYTAAELAELASKSMELYSTIE